MDSRLLKSLRQRSDAATDPVRAAVLNAQVAICHSRQGEHERAEALVRAIRERFGGDRPNAEALAWASLAEAVDRFFQHPGPQATDRLLRAQALGRMLPPTEVQPLCAAWLAHVEFNASRMERMVSHAVEALRLAQPDHHAALARVSLVVADAYHFAGRFDLAKGWYAAVHSHAVADGDDAMISALLHNRATLRTNQVRIADAFGESHLDEPRSAAMEAESTRNFDTAIGTRSLGTFLPLVEAQLLLASGNFGGAAQLMGIALEEDRPDNLLRRKASFFADRAWCYLRLGNEARALADVESAGRYLNDTTDVDDLAVTHARIGRVLEAVGRPEDAARHKEVALRNLAAFKHAQQHLLKLLAQVVA